MSTHTRCRKCDARKALSRWPTYLRCLCGGEYRLDAWMNSRVRCNCDGYWFIDNVTTTPTGRIGANELGATV